MRKKLLTLSLVIAMIFTSSITAFANSTEAEVNDVSEEIKAAGDAYVQALTYAENSSDCEFDVLVERVEFTQNAYNTVSKMSIDDEALLSDYIADVYQNELNHQLLELFIFEGNDFINDVVSLTDAHNALVQAIEAAEHSRDYGFDVLADRVEAFRTAFDAFEEKYYDIESNSYSELLENLRAFDYFAEMVDECEVYEGTGYEYVMVVYECADDLVTACEAYCAFVQDESPENGDAIVECWNGLSDTSSEAVCELFNSITGDNLDDVVECALDILAEESEEETDPASEIYGRLEMMKTLFVDAFVHGYTGAPTIEKHFEWYADTLELLNASTEEELQVLANLLGVETANDAKEQFTTEWTALSSYLDTIESYEAFVETPSKENAEAFLMKLEIIENSAFTKELFFETNADAETVKASAEALLADTEKESVDNTPAISVDVESYTVSSGDSLTVTGQGEFADFEKVLVDGEVVDEKYYTVKEGSTIITFAPEFLDTLKAGTHTIEMVWTTGSESIEVDFVEADPVIETTDDKEPSSKAPETGDNMVIWLAMAALSTLGALTLRKKAMN